MEGLEDGIFDADEVKKLMMKYDGLDAGFVDHIGTRTEPPGVSGRGYLQRRRLRLTYCLFMASHLKAGEGSKTEDVSRTTEQVLTIEEASQVGEAIESEVTVKRLNIPTPNCTSWQRSERRTVPLHPR